MKLDYKQMYHIPIYEVCNVNFAAGCIEYGLDINEAIDIYKSMFTTGHKTEIAHWADWGKPMRRFISHPYIASSILTDKYKNKLDIVCRFKSLYGFSDHEWQTMRSSYNDVNKIIANLHSYVKGQEPNKDEVGAMYVAKEAMNSAYMFILK